MDRGTLARLRESVRYTKEREKAINLHLGKPEDYEKGSLCVHIRWDDLEALLDIAEGTL